MDESRKARKDRRERENMAVRKYSPFAKAIEHYLFRMELAMNVGDLANYNKTKTKLERLYRFIKSDPIQEWRKSI